MLKYTIKWMLRVICTASVRKRCQSCGEGLRVNFPSRVNRRTHLGNNVNLNGLEVQGESSVRIGDNFHSGKRCFIITDSHNYEGNKIPYDEAFVGRDVVIEDNVWLGFGVIVLGGVTICEGAIIQAGSVVVTDIPKCGIAGGHPARVFKYRDVNHYTELKRLQRFH